MRRLNYGPGRPVSGNLMERRKRLQALLMQRQAGLTESVLGTAMTALALPHTVGARTQQAAHSDHARDEDTEALVAHVAHRGVKGAGKAARLRSRWRAAGRNVDQALQRQGIKARLKGRPKAAPAPSQPPAVVDKDALIHKTADAPRTPARAPYKGGAKAALRGAGAGAALAVGTARSKIQQGYRDRMDEYHKLGESANPNDDSKLKKPANAPATKAPTKPKKPKVEKPVAASTTAAGSQAAGADMQPILTPEQQLSQRAAEIRQSLSRISMASAPSAAKPASAPAPGGSAQQKRESASHFLQSLIEAKRVTSEGRMKRDLKSRANLGIRRGTAVTHTFYSNNRQHVFAGNPLAMRQKILAEHRRKNFQLQPGFENMSPIEVGQYFDSLSDRGMLDRDRATLDDNLFRNSWRAAKRVSGRAYRSAKSFLSGLLSSSQGKKAKESDVVPTIESGDTGESRLMETEFCQFAVGNVKYPHDCDCSACAQLLETSATSFGQNMRSGTSPGGNISELIGADEQEEQLLKRKKRRKRRTVREACDDAAYKAMMQRELLFHGKNPEPVGIARRPRTYFNVLSDLRKLDRLGMNLAMTALALNRLAPAAHRFLMRKNQQGAEDGATTVQQVFYGKPVKEADPFPDVSAADTQFATSHPRLHAFLNSPVGTTRKLGQEKVLQATGHLRIPNSYAYPLSMAGGALAAAGGVYAGKKLIYDPLQKKMAVAKERLERARREKSLASGK